MCDRVQPLGEYICPSCTEMWKPIKSPYCRKCGKPLRDERQEYCPDCSERKHFYREGRALYEYPDIKRSIYRFKYKGRKEYGEFYGKKMAEYLGAVICLWHPDALVPVPLHRIRKRERGYNQAEVIARSLGKELGIPVNTSLIKRVKKTTPQKCLNRQMRQNNLKRAFKIDQNDVKLDTIIIIDDIYTTGSTVDAMAAVLQEAGIRDIYFISLAVGRG